MYDAITELAVHYSASWYLRAVFGHSSRDVAEYHRMISESLGQMTVTAEAISFGHEHVPHNQTSAMCIEISYDVAVYLARKWPLTPLV